MTNRELAKWRAERRKKERQEREAGPKADILNLLESKGIRFFRMNSGSSHIAKGNHINLNKRGTPDIQMVLPIPEGDPYCKCEWIVWLEIKKSDGKQSKEQIAFEEEARCKGEEYLLIRSAAELEEWLKNNM